MRDQEIIGLWEAYQQVHAQEEVEQLDERLTGERLEKAKEIIARDPKSPKAKIVRRIASSQEGSDRGDTVPGDLPRDRGNTTLPTRRGGGGRRGRGTTTNRPGGGDGYPLGGRVGHTDQGRGNRARRRAGEDVEDTRESVELFDYLLEYLVAEGYADTNKAALVIMANMSEEWKQSIVEQSSIGARAAKVVDDQRQGYHGDADAFNKLQDAASKSMGRLKRGQGPVVTPGLPGV